MPDDQTLKDLFGEKAAVKRERRVIIADRSRVEQYATCPFQAWYCRENNVETHNIPCEVGNALHGIAEEQIQDAIDQHLTPDELAEEIVNAVPQTRPDIQPRVVKAARMFAHQVCDLRLHDVIGVEYQIDDACKTGIVDMKGNPFKLTACLDVLLKGRNALHVWDWKSGFKKRTKEDVEHDFQAQFDCNILWQMYDGSEGSTRIETIHWWFVETYWGTMAYHRFERDAEYPSLPHLTLERQIQGRIFEAIKYWQQDCREAWPESKKCLWCDIVNLCPHKEAGLAGIPTDPKALIDQMVVLEQALKKHQAAAKEILKKHGPISGTEMTYDWRPSTRFTPKLYAGSNGDEDE